MKEVTKFLKDCGTFYLATIENEQPRVRPFGAVCEFDDKFYIVTNNKKKVFQQIMNNPKIELSGMSNGQWIRLTASAILDSRREARVAMLEANSSLSSMYDPDDKLMEVLYLDNLIATVYSFGSEPKVIS